MLPDGSNQYSSKVILASLDTVFAYLQHFLSYDTDGNKRLRPYLLDLTSAEGLDFAVQLLRWCGNNFPGWENSKKPSQLVSNILFM